MNILIGTEYRQKILEEIFGANVSLIRQSQPKPTKENHHSESCLFLPTAYAGPNKNLQSIIFFFLFISAGLSIDAYLKCFPFHELHDYQ